MGSPPDIRPYLEVRTSAPRNWSPDDAAILVSSDVPGTAQLHRLDLDGTPFPIDVEELARITAFDEPAGGAYLHDDSAGEEHQVLVVSDRGGDERHQLYRTGDRPPGPLRDPADLEPLVVGHDHIHRPGAMSRDGRLLAYATNRADGVAFDTWVMDLRTGEERRVYATGGWTGPVSFSPDGRWLAVSEMTHRPADNRVHLVDLNELGPEPTRPDGPAATELAPHADPASVGAPSWLPASDVFYFPTDVGRDHAGIARGGPDGRWTHVVEPGWDADCLVDRAGLHLLVLWNADGLSRAELRHPESLEVTAEVPLPGDGVVGETAFSRDGRYLTFGFSSPLVPGDAWRYDTRTEELERLTTSPCEVDPARFVDAEPVRFASFDGLEVPAFVFRPNGPGPHPVVVRIHGGPESQYRPSFETVTQYLVARGFAVVAPNVRGSTGYGRRYVHLDDVEKRLDSVADLAALHDWLATQPDLDEDRAALYGGSYGGYMVLAGLAFQPERWAAGVDIVGISDLVTFLENTSAWRRAFREREYGSLERDRDVLEHASPITHVDRMRAPLFIIHGANDPRVPLSEAEQIHQVLTHRGVKSELIVYEDEGHGLAKLRNRLDAYPRVADFLHEVLR